MQSNSRNGKILKQAESEHQVTKKRSSERKGDQLSLHNFSLANETQKFVITVIGESEILHVQTQAASCDSTASNLVPTFPV